MRGARGSAAGFRSRQLALTLPFVRSCMRVRSDARELHRSARSRAHHLGRRGLQRALRSLVRSLLCRVLVAGLPCCVGCCTRPTSKAEALCRAASSPECWLAFDSPTVLSGVFALLRAARTRSSSPAAPGRLSAPGSWRTGSGTWCVLCVLCVLCALAFHLLLGPAFFIFSEPASLAALFALSLLCSS